MKSTSTQWRNLCIRLGVQPRQFATLLAVLAVGVGGLGIRAMSGGPRKATAATVTTPSKTGASKKPAATPDKPGSVTNTKAGRAAGKPASRRVIEFAPDRQPARDPFEVWGLPKPVVQAQVPVTRAAVGGQPGFLPGLVLKAVVSGELAVFGDQTVRVGDAVALPDGTFARIVEIRARTVSVDWNGRAMDVNFGSAPQPKNPAPGGFR